MLTRAVQATAAVVSIFLVGRFLTEREQGYYYAFLSFVVFIQLSEFGLAYAVMQSASHEAPLMDGMDNESTRRLSHLLRGALRLNTFATVLAALVVAGVGTRMLLAGDNTEALVGSAWLAPWVTAIVTTAASQLLNPYVALTEGSGYVAEVWLLRLRQESATAVGMWLGLVLGLGLWSIAVGYGIRLVVAVVWLRLSSAGKRAASLGRYHVPFEPAYWWGEVWPFQWRIGVSALSGYLIFQFFTPLLFALKGPEIAGQFGMTLALTNGLLTATTAWLTSQAPLFGRLIAAGSFEELDRKFRRSMWTSFATAGAGGIAMTSLLFLLNRFAPATAARLVLPSAFALFVAATLANHLIFAMAVYLRAHRREPLMLSSVAGALLTPLTIYVAGRFGGPVAIAAGYFALTMVGLVIATTVFLSRSRAWHMPAASGVRL